MYLQSKQYLSYGANLDIGYVWPFNLMWHNKQLKFIIIIFICLTHICYNKEHGVMIISTNGDDASTGVIIGSDIIRKEKV